MKTPRADKDLGQHFLKDKKVIDGICQDVPSEATGLIEVGPGPATLTQTLATLEKKFYVVEKDTRFEENLRECLSEEQIQFADALAFDLDGFIEEKELGGKVSLVSNLPYNISTPLLVKFLQVEDIAYMTLMFQKEVAEKVFSREKNSMSSLMALTQNYFECRLLLKVAPGAFLPPPRVDSAVLTFSRKPNPEIPLSEFETYEKYLRKLFSHRRKQIGGILKQHFEASVVEKALQDCQIASTLRAEALQLAQVQLLYKKLGLYSNEH